MENWLSSPLILPDMLSPAELKVKASDRRKVTKELFKKLKRKKPKELDQVMENLHYKAFARIDCLDCANCCKCISPFLIDKDIQKISKFLRVKPSDFVSKYLVKDEENDFVFKETPCPFLMPDNYCSIYDVRPRACREYPHTDRKKFIQILDLSLKNTEVCPAVYGIVEDLHRLYK